MSALVDKTEPIVPRLAIIGLGLLGSSLSLAARTHAIATTIVGCDASEAVVAEAKELGLCDDYTTDPSVCVENADLVILATPVGTYEGLAGTIAPKLKAGAILSDVGSVKEYVIASVAPHMPKGVHFVPAHPVAGSEKSGPTAGFAELFEDRWCIITPMEGTDEAAISVVTEFWKRCGSSVASMDPVHHDKVLAITSHIPHLIAYNIVGTASDLEDDTREEVIKFSAGGFRDFTRIAASDPTMWRDVFLANKEAVLEMLGRFTEDLTALQRAIRRDDGDALFDLFSRTRSIRQSVIDFGQDTEEPDFGRPHKHRGSDEAEG